MTIVLNIKRALKNKENSIKPIEKKNGQKLEQTMHIGF